MNIIVNGEALETEGKTLLDVMAELGFEGEWLATAVNNQIVHKPERSHHALQHGDRIEILSPMEGG